MWSHVPHETGGVATTVPSHLVALRPGSPGHRTLIVDPTPISFARLVLSVSKDLRSFSPLMAGSSPPSVVNPYPLPARCFSRLAALAARSLRFRRKCSEQRSGCMASSLSLSPWHSRCRFVEGASFSGSSLGLPRFLAVLPRVFPKLAPPPVPSSSLSSLMPLSLSHRLTALFRLSQISPAASL